MKEYTITTTELVTQEDVDNIVTTALEGGITYWCDKAETNVDLGDRYLSEMLTRGATIKLHDAEEDKWVELTLDKLLDALGKQKFNFDDYDSADADAAVQRAVFGEVVYG